MIQGVQGLVIGYPDGWFREFSARFCDLFLFLGHCCCLHILLYEPDFSNHHGIFSPSLDAPHY